MNELLPCPFCGSKNIDVKGWASTDRDGPACDDCGGTADTVELWNSRPAQQEPWQPIDTIPQNRPIDGWHKVWKCPVTISYRSWGDRNAWVEKTLTTEWPIEAFTHWRETSEAPALTSTPGSAAEKTEGGAS